MNQRLSPKRLKTIDLTDFGDNKGLVSELFSHIEALEAEIVSLKQLNSQSLEAQVRAIRGAVERARAQVYELDRYDYNDHLEAMRGNTYGEYLDRDQVLDALAAPQVVLDLNERPAAVIAQLIAEEHERSGD